MTTRPSERERLVAGARFPDVEMLDHAGNRRRLLELQDDVEVAYSRMISASVDRPEINAAFRAGLGAR